jgi:hypothetical protein
MASAWAASALTPLNLDRHNRVASTDVRLLRRIVRDAAKQDHRMSAYILGVVRSPAFRMQRAESAIPKATDASSGASSPSSK